MNTAGTSASLLPCISSLVGVGGGPLGRGLHVAHTDPQLV